MTDTLEDLAKTIADALPGAVKGHAVALGELTVDGRARTRSCA